MKLFFFSRKRLPDRAPLITAGIVEAMNEDHARDKLSAALMMQGWPDSGDDFDIKNIEALPKHGHGVLCIGVLHTS